MSVVVPFVATKPKVIKVSSARVTSAVGDKVTVVVVPPLFVQPVITPPVPSVKTNAILKPDLKQ